MRCISIAAATVLALLVQPATAQQSGDAARGLELARQWCADCHVIRKGEGRSASDAAPTFPSIAAMRSTTRATLLVFLQTPHRQMPNLALSRTDMSDLAEHIIGLRGQ